jgi:hypothetical protein
MNDDDDLPAITKEIIDNANAGRTNLTPYDGVDIADDTPQPYSGAALPSSLDGVHPDLKRQFEESELGEFGWRNILATVDAAMAGLEPGDARSLQSSFDSLPMSAIDTIRQYVAVGPGGSAPAASDAAVARFTSTPEGQICAEAWRGRTARNLGRLEQRMRLMLEGMPDDKSADAAATWLERLNPQQAAAVYKALAK